jgi:alkylhydroperoxidase/carboxymuconolactone decarboxylase family protein YurZ
METKLPSAYRQFATDHPRVIQAYEQLGDATLTDGPLDRKTAELVKLGLAVGARLEGAVHAHVRRAQDAGASAEEVRHAIRLATTTVGFPTMMSALSWANDVLAPEKA